MLPKKAKGIYLEVHWWLRGARSKMTNIVGIGIVRA